MGHVVVGQAQADALKGLGGRGDLGKHVDAVRVFLDHPLQASHLALDAPEPLEMILLVVGVSGHDSSVAPSGWE